MEYFTPIDQVKGVGDKTKEYFEKIGVYTVGDILLSFPRTYFSYPNITNTLDIKNKINEYIALELTLKSPGSFHKTRRGSINKTSGYTKEGLAINLIWFNASWIKNSLKGDRPLIFYGRLTEEGGHYTLTQPEVFESSKYQELVKDLHPIYSLTKGLKNSTVKNTVKEALQHVRYTEHYSQDLLNKYDLCDINTAYKQIHFPDSFDSLIKARRRLVFDEIFAYLCVIKLNEADNIKVINDFEIKDYSKVESFINKLPYDLTKGQNQAYLDIMNDFKGQYVSQRLIQGDVGCGKTLVAFLAMLLSVSNGYQAAIMAPTEVLAKQHYKTLCDYINLAGFDYDIVCLTGSNTAKEKREIYNKIANEESLFIVGTHALIQDAVEYNNLACVITDEQHRFGVKQRNIFFEKNQHPYSYVMSATPIPRTLSMILYSDMNYTVIFDTPKDKKHIMTCVIKKAKHNTALDFIKKEVKAGHQAYAICPLVEANETTEAENVKDYAEKISEYLGEDIRIQTLHGKMKAKEKNSIMELYNAGDIDVLVSTTVVEVGVDNPNSTVIIIENANRFGLAQLHQLRGRVGRGSAQSYCIFMDSTDSEEICPRLKVINTCHDGFELAKKDLELRGPGDYYGVRQSGDMSFRLADIFQDAKELEEASRAVNDVLRDDPDLSKDYNQKLLRYINACKLNLYTNL